MEEKRVTIADAAQFIRGILTLGGVFRMDPNTDYILDSDGKPITVEVNKKDKMIMLWSEKARLGDHVLLNVFGETINTTEERRWFYSFVSMIPGKIIRDLMMTVLNKAVEKDASHDYAAIELISQFVNEIDDKTKNEFDLFKAADVATIVYHKPSKTAQLQTHLFDEEFRNSFGKKIRAKSWKLFENLFLELMNVENIEQLHSSFKAEAQILGMKQADALIHVLVKFVDNINESSRTLLNTDYNVANLLTGVENLHLFYTTMKVFTSGGGVQVESKANATTATALPATPIMTPFGRVCPAISPEREKNLIRAGDSIVSLPTLLKQEDIDKAKVSATAGFVSLPQNFSGLACQQPAPMVFSSTGMVSSSNFGRVVPLNSNPQGPFGMRPVMPFGIQSVY